MAEVVGLVASIATLLSVAKMATKISRSLFRIAREAGSIEQEIYSFASQIRAFGSVTDLVHASLDSHCGKKSKSPVLDYMKSHKVLDQLSGDSELIKDRIVRVKPQIKSLLSRFGVVTSIKWFIMKSDILRLGPDMESVKTSLMLVMSIVKLELAMESSDEMSKEIESLRRQIGVLLDTTSRLQQGRLQPSSRPTSRINRSYHSVTSEYHSEYGALFELGESIIDHGVIPGQQSPIGSSPSLSANDDHNAVHIAESRQSVSGSFSTTLESSRESLTIQPILPEEIRHSVAQTRIGDDSPESSTATPHSRDDYDFVNVQPFSYLLHLNPSHKTESVSGHIITPDGSVSATALLVYELEDNLISQAYAAQLHLQVDPLESDDAVRIDFGSGQQEKSIGTVVVEWSKGPTSHQISIKTRCSVVEHNIRPLIFGRPFVDRRRHYWSRNSAN